MALAVDVPMVFVMRNIVQNHLKNKSFMKKTTHPTINGVGFFCKPSSFQEPARVHLNGRLLGQIFGFIAGLGHYS